MYQRKTLATCGEEMIVLVVKEGKGIENFRIFSKTENAVDVGYSLINVKTPVIKEHWMKGVRNLYRTYYVLDLKEDKIYRVDVVNAWARFPLKTTKRAVILAQYTESEFSLEERNGELRNASLLKESKYKNCKPWADENDLPGSIHVLNLAERKVHKVVPQLIFLN